MGDTMEENIKRLREDLVKKLEKTAEGKYLLLSDYYDLEIVDLLLFCDLSGRELVNQDGERTIQKKTFALPIPLLKK